MAGRRKIAKRNGVTLEEAEARARQRLVIAEEIVEDMRKALARAENIARQAGDELTKVLFRQKT